MAEKIVSFLREKIVSINFLGAHWLIPLTQRHLVILASMGRPHVSVELPSWLPIDSTLASTVHKNTSPNWELTYSSLRALFSNQSPPFRLPPILAISCETELELGQLQWNCSRQLFFMFSPTDFHVFKWNSHVKWNSPIKVKTLTVKRENNNCYKWKTKTWNMKTQDCLLLWKTWKQKTWNVKTLTVKSENNKRETWNSPKCENSHKREKNIA